MFINLKAVVAAEKLGVNALNIHCTNNETYVFRYLDKERRDKSYDQLIRFFNVIRSPSSND